MNIENILELLKNVFTIFVILGAVISIGLLIVLECIEQFSSKYRVIRKTNVSKINKNRISSGRSMVRNTNIMSPSFSSNKMDIIRKENLMRPVNIKYKKRSCVNSKENKVLRKRVLKKAI